MKRSLLDESIAEETHNLEWHCVGESDCLGSWRKLVMRVETGGETEVGVEVGVVGEGVTR